MDNNFKQMELLAPAGSPDSLMAAVANGADAVYLGLNELNARSSAVNFSRDNLREHIEYCHIRGVKVYITLNILLYENEMQEAYDSAAFAYSCGADAVIIQDLGLLSVLKKELPSLELHASTQTSINNRSGADYMHENGISRVILAREMTLPEIKAASSGEIQTEVFIHGARCYSYSGQCLMSSMLGGRSGNRGRCAQPCRLPYTLADDSGNILLKGHLLSLKDTFYIDSINRLRNAGVSALKIEGRMKGPEYVASVTSIYRKYIDMHDEYDVSEEDMDDLLRAFNRSGYSKGALSSTRGKSEFSIKSPKNSGLPVGRVVTSVSGGSIVSFTKDIMKGDGLALNGKGCFSGKEITAGSKTDILLEGRPGDIVFITKDTTFLKKYSLKNTSGNKKIIPLTASAVLRAGFKPTMSVADPEGRTVTCEAEEKAEKAISGGTAFDRIHSQLQKTGGTPYEITKLDLECEDGIYIKISSLNTLRRELLEKLSVIRAGECNEIKPVQLPLPIQEHIKQSDHDISICFYRYPENLDLSKLGIGRIYIDLSEFSGNYEELYNECRRCSIKLYLAIPYSCKILPDNPCDGYLIENHGFINMTDPLNTVLGTGFNITNSHSIMHYREYGTPTLSYEMSKNSIRSLGLTHDSDTEIVVYGKPQVMESPYCPARDICSGDLCIKNKLSLTDRMDTAWDVLFNPAVHSIRIFNPHRIMLTEYVGELKSAGINRFRINITDESVHEVYNLINAVRTSSRPRLSPRYKFTSSHYFG